MKPILEQIHEHIPQESKITIPEVYALAIGDAPLNATTPIRGGAEPTILSTNESVVVLTSWYFCASEPGTDLEGFRCRYGEHGMCKGRFELVENGFAQTRGSIPDDAGDGSPDRILSFFSTENSLRARSQWKRNRKLRLWTRTFVILSAVSRCGHRVGCLSTSSRVIVERSFTNSGVRASCAVSSSSSGLVGAREGGASEAGRCNFPTELTKATISTPYASFRYFSAIAPAATRPDGNENGQAPTRMAHTDSFSGTAATAPTAGLYSVFLEVCIVRMARPRIQVGLGVIMGPLIFIFYKESDRCT